MPLKDVHSRSFDKKDTHRAVKNQSSNTSLKFLFKFKTGEPIDLNLKVYMLKALFLNKIIDKLIKFNSES